MTEADALAKLAESTERNWDAVNELSAAANRISLAAEKMGNQSSARATITGERPSMVIGLLLMLLVVVWSVQEVRLANATTGLLEKRLYDAEQELKVQNIKLENLRVKQAEGAK